MSILRGLAPIADAHARVLVLGSMPGGASLRAGEYYAHGQNRFWRYMGQLVDASPSLPYQQRVERLVGAGIALWDVIECCRREGSLDSAIRDASANDFATFFAGHPKINAVLFNGAKAEATFMRQVLPTLATPRWRFVRLPSTSPAHASQTDAAKLGAWRDALRETGARLLAP